MPASGTIYTTYKITSIFTKKQIFSTQLINKYSNWAIFSVPLHALLSTVDNNSRFHNKIT